MNKVYWDKWKIHWLGKLMKLIKIKRIFEKLMINEKN